MASLLVVALSVKPKFKIQYLQCEGTFYPVPVQAGIAARFGGYYVESTGQVIKAGAIH